MKIEELKKIKDQRPFQAFRIRLTDGKEIEIKRLMSGNWCGCQALAQRDGAPRRRKSLPDGQMRGE